MRVCMVAWSFFPRAGGSATTAVQLSESLARKGLEVSIIAPLCKCDEGLCKDFAVGPGIKMEWVVSPAAKDYSGMFSRAVFFFKMAAKVREVSRDTDIFHAHDFNIGLLSALCGSGKPVVAVFGADPLFEMFNYGRKRDIPYEDLMRRFTVRALQAVMKALLSLLDRGRLVVISLDRSLDEAIRRYHRGSVKEIPAGTDLALYRAEAPAMQEENLILAVSRLMSWKGIDTAVEVFRKIKGMRPSAKMLIAGDGPLKGYFLQEYGGIEGLSFVTGADYKAAAGLYKKASIFLCPSRYETFGINIVEAMAAGLPVVARDLEVFRGRIADGVNGFLVEGDDPDKYADKLLFLLDDKDARKKMSEAAVRTARGYDMGVISERFAGLYDELAKEFRK